jgi:hypothetical protein
MAGLAGDMLTLPAMATQERVTCPVLGQVNATELPVAVPAPPWKVAGADIVQL